jgi:hypothetical protein
VCVCKITLVILKSNRIHNDSDPSSLVNSSPSDCHLFPALKKQLGGLRFEGDSEANTLVDDTGYECISTRNLTVHLTI